MRNKDHLHSRNRAVDRPQVSCWEKRCTVGVPRGTRRLSVDHLPASHSSPPTASQNPRREPSALPSFHIGPPMILSTACPPHETGLTASWHEMASFLQVIIPTQQPAISQYGSGARHPTCLVTFNPLKNPGGGVSPLDRGGN